MNKSKLEIDYTEFSQQLKAKLAEATKALVEANELAKAAKTCLRDINFSYDEEEGSDKNLSSVNCYDLIDELSNAGWSTSSMSC